MSNNKQSSIEWLIEQLPLIQQEGLRDDIEQAKAMYNTEMTEMIEFAQLHVKAALDAAAESIECYPSEQVAIVTSYPLTNIK